MPSRQSPHLTLRESPTPEAHAVPGGEHLRVVESPAEIGEQALLALVRMLGRQAATEAFNAAIAQAQPAHKGPTHHEDAAPQHHAAVNGG